MARIRTAIQRVSRWMNTHGAPLLVENLAPGATAERLAQAETEFGVALPADLRALWSLHDGQREQHANGFIEIYNLLSVEWALVQRETVLAGIEFARESPDWWKESGGTEEELLSDHWLPFAAQDSDSLVVHGLTGRVFQCDHDDSPKLLAPSLGQWFERFAAQVEADDYAVEEGFGDYYLERRDREAEHRAELRQQQEAAHQRMRREVPILDQFRVAISNKDAERCIEVLQDAGDDFNGAVELLFKDDLETTFVASALRPFLNAVTTLTPDQWVDVAVGGALLGNHAIRDIAASHATELSASRLKQLEKAMAAASSPLEHDAMESVLQKLRAMQPADPPPNEGQGNWLSRLFKKRPPKA
ncbi:SMI1/KNR4 family protein [Pendulispora brunnea]|uniref:SMI1/KNR4 family protein n=1 Tax=Pendulispora brunnea TaxID=2905690 RepID=A0ABZ2K9P7_9BACT